MGGGEETLSGEKNEYVWTGRFHDLERGGGKKEGNPVCNNPYAGRCGFL